MTSAAGRYLRFACDVAVIVLIAESIMLAAAGDYPSAWQLSASAACNRLIVWIFWSPRSWWRCW